MPYKFVKYVGVELEGGWSSSRYHAFRDFGTAKWHHDGSVSGDADYVGEFVTPRPMSPHEISAWIEKHHPEADDVDSSCGMHVHVSFKKLRYYASLMEQHFFAYFKDRLHTWGSKMNIRTSGHGKNFWDRLGGRNDYCNDRFVPEAQLAWKEKISDRYTMLNFVWGLYGTIECRVLPMFKSAEIGQAAVHEILNIYEGYLRAFPPRVDTMADTAILDAAEEAEINDQSSLVLETV